MAKMLVDDCHKLTIYFLKPYLRAWYTGTVSWSRGAEKTGSISYQVKGGDQPSAIRLFYTITRPSDEKVECDYQIQLSTSNLIWGGVRYWFLCPLRGCGRRVGCLYLPFGGSYFGCRHCYQLGYESQYESSFSRLFDLMDVVLMQEDYPAITRKDVRALHKDKTTRHMRQLEIERYLRELQNYDPHEGYLSAVELCELSGLSLDNLAVLRDTCLLLPDTKDGRYRPKLAGWGKKLAYLMQEGWGIEEIQAWSKERWKSGNPRQWPPNSK